MVKNLPASTGDVVSVPALGRPPGGGNGTPLQYSCLGNPMDRGTWQATVHGGDQESDMTKHTACRQKSQTGLGFVSNALELISS